MTGDNMPDILIPILTVAALATAIIAVAGRFGPHLSVMLGRALRLETHDLLPPGDNDDDPRSPTPADDQQRVAYHV